MDEIVTLKEQVASLQSNVESSISFLSARPYIVKAPIINNNSPTRSYRKPLPYSLKSYIRLYQPSVSSTGKSPSNDHKLL